jgi:DNA-binding response OmpR family regulator
MSSSKANVIILETDDQLRQALQQLFTQEGFEVREEVDSGKGVAQVLRRQPSMILMSEDMPPVEDVELLPLLRRLTRAPIIVIGEGGEAAVVNALLQGADLYMTKPLNYRELLSRIRALLRRSKMGFGDHCSQISRMVPEAPLQRIGGSLSLLRSYLDVCLSWSHTDATSRPAKQPRLYPGRCRAPAQACN